MLILELGLEELSHGLLAAGFARGAVASVIHCRGNVRRLWSELVENDREQLPWEAPLIDIARNHRGSSDITAGLGDVYYFQPGHHCHIARKMTISREGESAPPQACPASFAQGEEAFTPEPRTLSECCELVDRIMEALTPVGADSGSYDVVVQRLKYQDRLADSDKLIAMNRNSMSRWGRVGFALDRSRERAAGPLALKGISDLLGALMLVPLLRVPLAALNHLLARFDRKQKVGPGERIIERPHCDQRYFSALCGTRTTIRTEVYVDGRWLALPVGLDSIVVLPGKLAAEKFGLRPTLHRVLHMGDSKQEAEAQGRSRNVTLLIGAAEQKATGAD